MNKQTTENTPKKKVGKPKGKPMGSKITLKSADLSHTNKSICERFREVWASSGLTQEDFAKQFGMSESYAKGIIQGKFVPSHEALHNIADEYKKSIDWFYGRVKY